jgi:hypothetical protein
MNPIIRGCCKVQSMIGRQQASAFPLSMTSDENPSRPADTAFFDLRMAALQTVLEAFFSKLEIQQPTRPRISKQDTILYLKLSKRSNNKNETYLNNTIVNVSASLPLFSHATHKSSLISALNQARLCDPGCHSDGKAMGTALTASRIVKSKWPSVQF